MNKTRQDSEMAPDDFMREMQVRLLENKKLLEKSLLPKPFSGVASYFAFHTFRMLVWLSFLFVVGLFWGYYSQLMQLSKWMFLYE